MVVGGSGEAGYALNRRRQRLLRTRAITDVDLLALEDELLDTLATWDEAARSDARFASGAFSLSSLRDGALAELPVAHVDELLKRFDRVHVARGETVIHEGDEGGYYYVIAAGRFQVERVVGGAKVVLAELKHGDVFGEEALVSEAKRNASVAALTEVELLRVGRADFNELLRAPLPCMAVGGRTESNLRAAGLKGQKGQKLLVNQGL